MLVIVYLVEAKKQIVIPQEWVMDLDQEILNNSGKNSNQNRRIFWSSVGMDGQFPDATIAPNFNLQKSTVFPPENANETCYLARIKRFCSTEDKANNFCEKFRSRLPAVYNARRVFEAPVPRTSPPLLPTASSEAPELEFEIENVSVQNENDDQIDNQNEEEEQNERNQPCDQQNTEQTQEENETKPQLSNIVLDASDSMVIDNMFDHESEGDENRQVTDANEETTGIRLQPNETTFYEDGVLKVTRKYSDGLELTYIYGEDISPYPPPRFVMKRNDIISKNNPFEENENGDRAYSVQIGDHFQEVKLSVLVVNCLLKLNSEENRDNVSKDKLFIKALLVGFFGVANIKADMVDKRLIRFMKELFSYRVEENDNDGERYTNFGNLCDVALSEIRNNIYNTKQ